MNEKGDVQRPFKFVRERFSAWVASQVVCNGFVPLVLAIEIDKNRLKNISDQLDAFMICLRPAHSRPKINKIQIHFHDIFSQFGRNPKIITSGTIFRKISPKKKWNNTKISPEKCDADYREIWLRPHFSSRYKQEPRPFFLFKKINWITRPIKRHNNLQLDGGRPSGRSQMRRRRWRHFLNFFNDKMSSLCVCTTANLSVNFLLFNEFI